MVRRLDVRFGQIERRSRLLDRVVEDVAEQQDGSRRRRQSFERDEKRERDALEQVVAAFERRGLV
jgi:hypothetical protein